MRALEMRAFDAWNRVRLACVRVRNPGLEIDPRASSNLALARYNMGPGATLRIAAGVVTERIAGRLHFVLYPGAAVEIQAGAWLRTEVSDLHIVAYEGARLVIGPETLLNGCFVSAKLDVQIGRRSMLGPGTRIYDADQHDMDAERPERKEPVRIGEFVWVAGDCTILRGVQIGDHSVVGVGSLVTGDIPAHTLAYGRPARPCGTVGDRTHTS
ncbi:MAG: acyltransferase [Deltaproteobacteria bacterium]|nr:acyltransferase [Deltaproteobacteria bacterium]